MNTSKVTRFTIGRNPEGVTIQATRQGTSDDLIFFSYAEALRLAELLYLVAKTHRLENPEEEA